jgi:hypothetical protein
MRFAAMAAIAAALLLAGCTTPPKLQYADGRIVECGPYFKPHSEAAAYREDACVRDHIAQGARRL